MVNGDSWFVIGDSLAVAGFPTVPPLAGLPTLAVAGLLTVPPLADLPTLAVAGLPTVPPLAGCRSTDLQVCDLSLSHLWLLAYN